MMKITLTPSTKAHNDNKNDNNDDNYNQQQQQQQRDDRNNSSCKIVNNRFESHLIVAVLSVLMYASIHKYINTDAHTCTRILISTHTHI